MSVCAINHFQALQLESDDKFPAITEWEGAYINA